MSERTHDFWLEAARGGTPPTPVEVAQKQYGLLTPWHIRETFLKDIRGLGSWPGKKKRGYNFSRTTGKTYGSTSMVMWAAEYGIPYLPKLRQENRRINIIGRDVEHLRRENMETIHNFIVNHAPWLKTLDRELWDDPRSLKELQIRQRRWTDLHLDLTNGVSIRGFGFNQNVRGGHVPLTILDDFIDDENAHHGADHFQTILGAVVPSVEDGGLIIADGTPIDDNDVWKHISAEDEWQFRSLPVYDEKGELGYREKNEEDIELGFLPPESIQCKEDLHCLWPHRMNYASVLSARGKTPATELAFLREYMMQRAAAWNLLVHPDYYRQSKRHDVCYHFGIDSKRNDGITFMGVDPSTLRRSNFAWWVATKLPIKNEEGNEIGHVIRPLYHEHVEVQANEDPAVKKARLIQAMERLRSTFHRFNPRKVVIEGNGFQSFIEPYLEDRDSRMRGRIETVTLTANKHFDDGWPLIRTVFEGGMVEMPYGPTTQEQVLIDRGELDPRHVHARTVTDAFWTQLQAVKYHNARILENEEVPRDSVAAFYFMLRAADYVPTSVGFAGVGHPTAEIARFNSGAKPRRLDPEFAPRHGPPGGLGQLAKAKRYSRR